MMKSLYFVDFLLCSILFISIMGFSNAELEQAKNRRAGGTSGLYTFPRVGRSDPSLHSAATDAENAAAAAAAFDILYPSSYEEYEELPKSDSKRLYANFPRVGRNDGDVRKWTRFLALQQALDKRAGPSATTGVWFGPRLGKRSVDKQTMDHSSGQKELY